jgi:hypothetical protein
LLDRRHKTLPFTDGHVLDALKQFNRAHAGKLTAAFVDRKRW